MKEKLEPAEDGLFRLKEEYATPIQKEVAKPCQGSVRFMLAGEISNIYKKNDKVRKIHNVVFLPTFEAVAKFQGALEKIGNIRSDGRPILGLDARDLLEIVLETDPEAHLIPAHIWTPWFSLLGSKSGFDSIEECFDDLTPHIFALETGLSSDPPMNWRLSALDGYTLVSNSDAHSPQKLAREANVFNTELSYPEIFEALKSGNPESYLGTIEFFPEEGKYHYDGHRKCGIRWDPKTTIQHDGICPECGGKVTVGVVHRVEELADREHGDKPGRVHPFRSLIPLPEVLGQVFSVGVNTKRVQESYELLLTNLGSELSILQDIPLEEIEHVGGSLLAEGIRRMRNGEIHAAEGYDGEYGVIRLFDDEERESYSTQIGFFPTEKRVTAPNTEVQQPQIVSEKAEPEFRQKEKAEAEPEEETPDSDAETVQQTDRPVPQEQSDDKGPILSGLNPRQREAALCTDSPLIIAAGPGTGKTRTITHRMAYLVTEKNVSPDNLLAFTFTNKAAEEMAGRLNDLLGTGIAAQVTIKTFHAFAATVLRADGGRVGLNSNFAICSEQDRRAFLRQFNPGIGGREINQYLNKISGAKNRLLTPKSPEFKGNHKDESKFIDIFLNYELALHWGHVLDFDDLILRSVDLFEKFPDILKKYQDRFRWISVDEYQDINFAQYRLLRLLAGPEVNLCVIGDPDQAIYGFRGANREYFLKFQEDFAGARSIYLNKNYRSIQPILNASQQVIAKSPERQNMEIWSDLASKTRISIYQAHTDKGEAEHVVHEIEKLVGGTSYFSLDSGRVSSDEEAASRAFSDFAVLFRIGAQSKLLEEAFRRSGIPYQTAGRTPFCERKEIKEILAYLWLLHNPDSIFHVETIFDCKGLEIGPVELNKLKALADENQSTLSEVMQKSDELDILGQPQTKQLRQVILFLNQLRAEMETQPVSRLIETIHEFILSGDSSDPEPESAKCVQLLITRASPFENRLQDFLESTVLQKETDEYDPRADRVALMTLHAAKGLEFPVVFIVGCEENLIPYRRAGEDPNLEEERRLLYVGMTRAQEKLVLTNAKSRFILGRRLQNKPSRFLSDIGNALKELIKMKRRRSLKEERKLAQMDLF
jgi:uncharacterized protein (TIGR00375 family)